jgi:hypothetical protein
MIPSPWLVVDVGQAVGLSVEVSLQFHVTVTAELFHADALAAGVTVGCEVGGTESTLTV